MEFPWFFHPQFAPDDPLQVHLQLQHRQSGLPMDRDQDLVLRHHLHQQQRFLVSHL